MKCFFLISLENMIRGLEGDETEFLDQVARQQQEINKRRYEEESKEMKGFRVRNYFCRINMSMKFLIIAIFVYHESSFLIFVWISSSISDLIISLFINPKQAKHIFFPYCTNKD